MIKRRRYTDVSLDVKLASGGTPLSWNDIYIQGACMQSDDQHAFAGRLSYEIDKDDDTLLHCIWDAHDQLYLGPHRIVFRVDINGTEGSFDIPAVCIVATSAEADEDGEITLTGGMDFTGLEATIRVIGQGPKGDPGPQGPQGLQGPEGPQGPMPDMSDYYTQEEAAELTQTIADTYETKKKWHKLVDYTTTEAVVNVSFRGGDNGEVFNDYDELMVVMMLQPTEASQRRIGMSVTNVNGGWGGQYLSFNSPIECPSSTEKSIMAYSWLQKTPMGILHKKLGRSANNASISSTLASIYCTGTTSQTTLTSLPTSAIWTPEQFVMPILPSEFKCVSIGCYTGKPIEANCKFIIFGLK